MLKSDTNRLKFLKTINQESHSRNWALFKPLISRLPAVPTAGQTSPYIINTSGRKGTHFPILYGVFVRPTTKKKTVLLKKITTAKPRMRIYILLYEHGRDELWQPLDRCPLLQAVTHCAHAYRHTNSILMVNCIIMGYL